VCATEASGAQDEERVGRSVGRSVGRRESQAQNASLSDWPPRLSGGQAGESHQVTK